MKKLFLLALFILLPKIVCSQSDKIVKDGYSCKLKDILFQSWHQVKHENLNTFHHEGRRLNPGDIKNVPKEQLEKNYLKLGDYEYYVITDLSFLYKLDKYNEQRSYVNRVYREENWSMDNPANILVKVDFDGDWENERTMVYIVFRSIGDSCYFLDNTPPIYYDVVKKN